MKRILIDANPIVPYYAIGRINGIGRTCMELIQGLNDMPEIDIPFDIYLYTQNIKGLSSKELLTRFKSIHSYLRNTRKWNLWAKRIHVREILSKYDLQHITHNYEIVSDPSRCIVTVHDAMFFSYPEDIVSPESNRRLIPPFLRSCKHVITISENSKREIMQYMDVPEDKITVIPWGVDHNILYPHNPGTNHFCGDSPYFISVSCDIGRKNTISLVKAYAEFAKHNPAHHLMLVWRNPSDEAKRVIEESHIGDLVHFASNLSNEELGDLYAGATASFFPSLYEGFGLPIAESLACGVPCVTARNSSLEEVGGEAAIYVEPMNIYAMSQIMENFENGSYDMDKLKSESILQASKFTWDNCARQTVDVYKKCLDL